MPIRPGATMARTKHGGWNGQTTSKRKPFHIRLPGALGAKPVTYAVSVRKSRALRQWDKVRHGVRGAALIPPLGLVT